VEGNHIGGDSGLIAKAQTSVPAVLLSFSIVFVIIFNVRAWDTLLSVFLRSGFGSCNLVGWKKNSELLVLSIPGELSSYIALLFCHKYLRRPLSGRKGLHPVR
jgi:hypothetical protein